MTAPRPGPRHYRNGPDIDVAMCGQRGAMLPFARAIGNVTCQDCKDRLDKVMPRRRNRREFLAMVQATSRAQR